MKSNSELM